MCWARCRMAKLSFGEVRVTRNMKAATIFSEQLLVSQFGMC
jgi:hypothetical protein